MDKSWTIYVTLWTTESDDVERKLRLRNTTNKRRRHGYESQTSSKGGGVRGRPVENLECSKKTNLALWRSDEARRRPRAVRRTRGHLRRSTAFEDPASRVFTTRFVDERPSPARTLSTAGRVVTVEVRELDVRSFESAGRWTGIFCLVELARRSISLSQTNKNQESLNRWQAAFQRPNYGLDQELTKTFAWAFILRT